MDVGIAREREKLAFLKKRADYIIDTSQLLSRELKQEIDRIFVQNQGFKNLIVTVLSFGFKYGIPSDADLVFDVRFLPNPYYIEELRPYSGNDKPVRDFVMNCPQSGVFLDKTEDLIRFLIPNYIGEGKNQLVIGIGCTGGKHRSVTLANALYERLRAWRTLVCGRSTEMWKRMPAVENKEKTEEISFSREVKEELCRQMPGARHCQVAELAAVLSLGGQIVKDVQGNFSMVIPTENESVAKKYFTLLGKTFKINREIFSGSGRSPKRGNTYSVSVSGHGEILKVLQAAKLLSPQLEKTVFFRQCLLL